MISAIERLDNGLAGGEEDIKDDQSMPPGIDETRNIEDDPVLFKALPLYKFVLEKQYIIYNQLSPVLLNTNFAIAETLKCLDKFEEAMDLHQDIFDKRRKMYGDEHPDTIESMFAIAELLRAVSKIYPDGPVGAFAAKQESKNVKSIKPFGVSLTDQFSSLVQPIVLPDDIHSFPSTTLKLRNISSSNSKTRGLNTSSVSIAANDKLNNNNNDNKWLFLSPPPETLESSSKVKEPLKIRKGYMGYEFPTRKKMVVIQMEMIYKKLKLRLLNRFLSDYNVQ
jgi:hypothetical protein